MADIKFCVFFPWFLLLTVICVVVQVSVALPRDVLPEIQRNPAEQIKSNVTVDEEIGHHVEQPSEVDDIHMGNDSRNCFPYFIYQDVESLLNQALKMLSVSKTERQRDWLQLFIHRLESLLTQLRRLPVKYVSRCFRMKERLNPNILTDSDVSSAPEEVQLQLAKKLFLHSNHFVNKKHHLDDRLKEYVMGRIAHSRRNDDTEYETQEEPEMIPQMPHQSNKAHIAQTSNKNNAISSNLGMYNFEPNLDATTDKSSSRYISGNNPYADLLIPITFWEKQNMNPETMPFLPRATRKIAHPVSEKMKFRGVSAHSKHEDETTKVEDQDSSDMQTRLPPPSSDYTTNNDDKHHQDEITSRVVWHPEDINVTPPTEHKRESLPRFDNHDLNSSPSSDAGYNTPITDKAADNSKTDDDDDDLVIQLHSGGKLPKQQMDPRIFMKSAPLEMKTWPLGIPEGQLTSPESEEIPNSKEQNQDSSEEAAVNTKMPTNRNDGEIPIASDNRNSLDFDYEEPGAAAGELFIDDDVIPTKYLTVPSSLSGVTSFDDNQDDIVRQLDDLKSLKSDAISPSNPIISTELAPLEPSNEDSDLPNHHLLTDSK